MLERPRSDSEYADEKGGTGPLDVFGGVEKGIEEGNVVIQFGKVCRPCRLLAARGNPPQLHDPPRQFCTAQAGLYALVEDV